MSMPKSPPSRELVEAARNAARNGQPEVAARLYRELFLARPTSGVARRLARTLQEMGSAETTREFLLEAVERFQGDLILNHMLARASQMRGDFELYEECAARMRSAIAKDPDAAVNPVFWPFLEDETVSPRRFLFVSGAPRSGTSALGRLLNLSTEIVLLHERYTYLYGYCKSMFNRDRLFQSGDTPFVRSNAKLLERYGSARFIGDKRPNFALSLRVTTRNFKAEEARVIHIVRDAKDVGLSYEARAGNELDKWPRDKGFQAGIQEVNWNNREILRAMQDPQWAAAIRVVEYRQIWSNEDNANALFDWLGVTLPFEARTVIKQMYGKAKSVATKARELTSGQERILSESFDADAHERLLECVARG